ncbi:MAG: alpha/beta hydrolase [Patescibacteria group bacterium]
MKNIKIETKGFQHQLLTPNTVTTDIPNIVWVNGGPGVPLLPQLPYEAAKNIQKYTIWYWEQPGVGSNYRFSNNKTIYKNQYTVDLLIESLHAAVQAVQKVSDQKVILISESFGTLITFLYAQKYPENLLGLISISQFVSISSGLKISSNILSPKLNKLEKLLLKFSLAHLNNEFGYIYFNSLVRKYKGYIHQRQANSILKHYVFRIKTIFSKKNKYNCWQFLIDPLFQIRNLKKELLQTDLRNYSSALNIPWLVCSGKYDLLLPTELATEFFNMVKCQNKKIVIFSNSAHLPQIEENAKYSEVINQFIRNLAL